MSPTFDRGMTYRGVARRGSARMAAVPKPGQLVCPVCLNAVTPRADGRLRMHRDLYGHNCYNRSAK